MAASKSSSGSSSGTSKSSGKSVDSDMVNEALETYKNNGRQAVINLLNDWENIYGYNPDSIASAWESIQNQYATLLTKDYNSHKH